MNAMVVDAFEVKGDVAVEYGAAGLVLCITSDGEPVNPQVGQHVLVRRADGWMIEKRVADVRNHDGKAGGFFIAGLTKADVPVGSFVLWGTEVADLIAQKMRRPDAAAAVA